MSKTIYTSAATSIYEAPTEQQSIELIIQSVRDGTYKRIVSRIRATQDKDQRNRLKEASLPVFYPTIRLSADGSLGEDSEPTGVVQFDIDMKDNPKLDVPLLKREITQHPACLYALTSPSGGLKFGILTDFIRPAGQTSDMMKRRFKIAYRVCLQHVLEHCSVQLIDDVSMLNIRQSCYLSYDPDAYFEAECVALHINDQCEIIPVSPVMGTTTDESAIQLALDQIPRILPYADRLSINLCILWMLGRPGIALLMNHWQKDDRVKLSLQLEDHLKDATFGSIALLWHFAHQHGYAPPRGTKRRNEPPVPHDYILDPLFTPEQATAKLQSVVRDFVTNKESHFINVTAGAGKTRAVLEALSREIDYTDKVLFLVPTHQLASEIVDAYNEIRRQDIDNATDLRSKTRRATIIALQGRKTLCENQEAKKIFGSDISIPPLYCSNYCQFRGDCAYTAQFNAWSNIRVMTHSEWTNEQSAWFNGRKFTNGGFEPNGKRFRWIPDFIVIDEDILKLPPKPVTASISSPYSSIRLIIESVKSGSQLKDAVWAHRRQVLQDSTKNLPSKAPPLTSSPESYVDGYKQNKASSNYSRVLAQLENFCRYDDASFLEGIWVDGDVINWLELPTAAARYNRIPTLYLDATANRTVVHRLLPDVHFHQIAVRQNDDVHLFQLSDTTLSQGFLKEPDNLAAVIDGLKVIVKGYAKVGVITYKTIGSDDNFAATLAAAIGAHQWMHFGNLRGMNSLEDVDCLLIVGRYFVPPQVTADHARAIFDHHTEWMQNYADLPVRMKDGRTFKLNSAIADDALHQAVYEHSSLSETLQAIGRGRPVHGSKKDIYVFSNENLTTNTEVTAFFPYERYFERAVAPPKPPTALLTAEALEKVKQRGFVQWIEGDLVEQLKLTKGQVKPKVKKQQIEAELIANGAATMDVVVRYSKGNTGPRTYMVFDVVKLEKALAQDGERLITA